MRSVRQSGTPGPVRRLVSAIVVSALAGAGVVGLGSPAQAAPTGSVVVYACGTSVCAIDPDVAGTERVIATNAIPAGVTRDGATAGIVDRSTNQVRTVALRAGGVTRVQANPGDLPEFATISDSGNKTGWVWYYAGTGWYAQVAPVGAPWSAQASSTSQVSIGWRGDDLLTTRRGATGFDSRICIEVAGGPVCDQQLASEPNRNLQLAFPDINPAGNSVVVVRGAEGTGFGLPYYDSLATYAVGSSSGPSRVLTNGPDTHPEFSFEGDRVVFERQGQGIFVIGADGTGLRKIADGSMPFWGGDRTDTPPPPPANAPPIGVYDAVDGGVGTVRVAGWGYDPTVASESIDARVWVGGPSGTPGAEATVIPANLQRDDVNQANGITGNHGFVSTLTTAKRGTVPVCVYLIDRPIGSNTFLGCKDATVTAPPTDPPPNLPPTGAYDTAEGGVGTVRVAGWGFDPTVSSESIDARVWIGGPVGTPGAVATVIRANGVRGDVNTAYGISGDHGFDATIPTNARGSVPACVYLIDRPVGVNTFLGCKDVTVTGPAPRPLGIVRTLPVARPGKPVRVVVRCPDGNTAGCAGGLTVSTAKKIRLSGSKKRVLVAQGSYRLAAGARKTVPIKVTRTGKKALARFRSIKAVVRSRDSGASGLASRKVLVIKRAK